MAFPIILKKGLKFSRKKFQIYMEKNNIQTRPIFSGNILRHPGFSFLSSKKNKVVNFKEADYIMKYGLLIGCHQGLNKKNLDYIHNIIKKFLKKHG